MDRPRISAGCLSVLLLFVLGCFLPEPKPQPYPDPINPIVTPVVGDLFLFVVEETGDRTPQTALTLQGSSEWWHKLGSRGVVYRWLDEDSPGAEKYAAAVKERPGLLMLDSNGKIVFTGPLPAKTEDIDKILKGAGK